MPSATNVLPPLALVVDDVPTERRHACKVITETLGWRICEAASGSEALKALANEAPSVVLTDLQMPDCDGLGLVETIRKSHPFVPIVLMTAWGSEKVALKALQQGAASYVPKNEVAEQLADSLERVVSAAQATQNRRRLLSFLSRIELEFILENDPALIPVLVTQIQDQIAPLQLCDQNGLIRIGVALEEAVLNAMYHGNLEVSSQLRQDDERLFASLVADRRLRSPYRDRKLHIVAALTAECARFTVADEGPGFDPATLPDPTDPNNLDRIGGRGLLLIQTFMDEVRFNERGNRITLVKHKNAPKPS
ncbi:MAG: ATP-binding protein [Gemmataceae bacterium]